MRFSKFACLLVLIICNSGEVWSEVPDLSSRALSIPPHRVTRTCCAFGSDLKLSIIPILKYSDITSVDQLGPHHYLGDPVEGNGIIYTLRGGFVDMGHLRDQADWTAYLYSRIILAQKHGFMSIHLGREGGTRILNLNVPAGLNHDDAVRLAGRVAYDLSVWHEIATWYGISSIPLMPERYSSFSIEDPYSNLLGITLGMAAIKSSLPYEEAMDKLIKTNLEMLGAVSSADETYMAMEAVRNIWWTRTKHLPSRNILIERQLGVYACLEPWLVPGWAGEKITSYDLVVPEKTSDGQSFNNFYELDFKLNYKFPLHKIFASRTDRRVTQADFVQLINHIAKDLEVEKPQ